MSLYEAIEARAARFSGTLGLWAHSLDTGETVRIRADEPFPAASTIKLPILYEVWRQAGEGRFALTESLSLRAEEQVPGSGVLKELTPGLSLPIRDLATLMIIVSDNTATNLLIDLVGREAVNEGMAALGLTNTRLENKLFRAPPGAPPNRSTPADLGRLLRMIARREVLTPEACAEMLQILGRQQITEGITRRIPEFDPFPEPGTEPLVTVASKSGAIRGTRNEVGLVEARGRRFLLCIMSRGCADRRFHPDNEASLLLAEVSALLYRHFVG
ncbi:MAG: serine hydrolase [Bacillota bacterium]